MRVICVFLRHGTQSYAGSFERLVAWYRNWLPEVTVEFVVVDNAISASSPTETAAGVRVLAGDNRAGEFSGFAAGLRQCPAQVAACDLVHFVTSAYEQNYDRYLEHVEIEALEIAATSPTCLGHIDAYEQGVFLQGSRSRHWMRTCFFFLSPASIAALPAWDNAPPQGQVFDQLGTFRPGASLDPGYRQRLIDWLTGKPQQGVIYHSPRLTPSAFERKVMAILREHALAITLRNLGVRLLDFAFSHALVEHGRPLRDQSTMAWEEQVAVRTDWLQRHPPERPESPVPLLQWNEDCSPNLAGGAGPCMRTGWSTPEPGFCWTDGHFAIIRCRCAQAPRQPALCLTAAAFTPSGQTQRVALSLNGLPVADLRMSSEVQTLRLALPRDPFSPPSRITLRFDLPDATSPAESGISPDARRLGLSVRSLCFEDA